MTIWKYMFDSDVRQRDDIERLSERSRKQQRNARRMQRRSSEKMAGFEDRIAELEEQVGSLQLINRALLEMLRKNPSWSDAEFKQLVYDLDMEDGVLDGR